MVGSYVIRELLAHDHEPTIFSRNPTALEGVGIIAGDIRDIDRLKVACEGQDAIIHSAAITGDWLAQPEVILHTNVIGTVNVLEAAVHAGISNVVVASSTAASGYYRHPQPDPLYFPFDEEHPVRPIDCYALSKYLNEETCESYSNQHGINAICLRFSTRYVDQEGPKYLVPNEHWGVETVEEFWDKFLAMIDNPLMERWTFWAYVDPRDLALAYRIAAENPREVHGTYYIVADDTMCRTSTPALLEEFFPSVPLRRQMGRHDSLISHSKATRELGWKPLHSWRDNLYLLEGISPIFGRPA